MNVTEKILIDLQTEEGKTKIKQWSEDYIKKEKEKNKKATELVSNLEYILWLEKFTNEHQSFYDDEWWYTPRGINEKDRDNSENLPLFYRGIKNYAIKNFIYTTLGEFGNCYKIRLNDIGYEIGIADVQGTIFFCNRVEPQENFIDFPDIINNKENNKSGFVRNEKGHILVKVKKK